MGWAVAALLAVAGCTRAPELLPSPPTASWYRAPDFALNEVRRVIVLPMEHPPQDLVAADRVRQAMAAELQKTGRFEVLCPPEDYFTCWRDDSLLRGIPTAELLADLARHFAVDGVVFSSLRDYDVYGLPRISVVVHLVCTYNGMTLASVDGQWDAQDAAVASRAIAYAQHKQASHRLGDAQMILKTPSWYERFVATELAGLLFLPPS
jgi:hypothetical protein